ncbi:TIGR03915 family putative DNA repair protein [Zunongwangia sp. F363]|uniref:TIGR03915 family putative DNA repair protein n=1 Tax=Autumnicola tepida TaxID=3075595 RepID=A0ABU3C5E8_9FLAO|nr:TIGR03915 family putative DNA repair protein [Zunongwangia sp. F363]MDT0641553.1 TIGR03915 family putative DNA repair protein [Zunongwangia sp. F363]
MKSVLCYDGSLEGLLTCVFVAYEEKLEVLDIQVQENASKQLFGNIQNIITQEAKASRVALAIKRKCTAAGQKNLYRAFLSEEQGIEMCMFQYLQYLFESKKQVDEDFSHPAVLKIAQTAKKVGREKHRMEAFVRFQLTKDDIYFANIEPDFNVLPLIKDHFKKRYSDQKWIIYDLKRNFGLYHDLQEVNRITLDFSHHFNHNSSNSALFTSEEIEFKKLWKEYFTHTNIPSRRNMKLHLQHVPKRYWKYLSEKSPLHN